MIPRKYFNISKKTFISLKSLKSTACILFIPKDGYHDKPEYPDYYIPNLKAKAQTADDVLYIEAEDVGLSWKSPNTPTKEQLKDIVNFIQKNSDKVILSVCDAGVSRSGFVTFYLDILNNNINDVGCFIDDQSTQEVCFTTKNREVNRYITNPAFTKYLLESSYITEEQKAKLTAIIKYET